MSARVRERTLKSVSGGYSVWIDPYGAEYGARNLGTSGAAVDEYCSDTTMSPPFDEDHNLNLRLRKAETLRLNGDMPWSPDPSWVRRYDSYAVHDWSLAASCPLVSTPSDAYWMTKALANMNPSRPLVDLPLFIFELKDFPRMLMELGAILENGIRKVRPADVPRQHLAIAFGWIPLVNDLLALADLARSIEKRKAYLKALEKGTRVKHKLFDDEIQRYTLSDHLVVYSSNDVVLQADVERTEELRVWFTANAKLVTQIPDADSMVEYGYAQALGLNASAETLWNAFPWSWLIDYFINVGDFLAANRGYIAWKSTRMNIMYRQVARSNLTNVRLHSSMSLNDGGRLTTTSKRRTVYADPIPLLAWDPFLTDYQTGILGSLVTLKSLRGTSIAR